MKELLLYSPLASDLHLHAVKKLIALEFIYAIARICGNSEVEPIDTLCVVYAYFSYNFYAKFHSWCFMCTTIFRTFL